MKKIILLALLASMSVNAEIGKDKYMHFGGSVLMGGVAQYATDNVYVSFGSCLSVGLAKEAYDQYSYGGFSKKDLLADALGCGVGTLGVKWLTGYYEGDAVGVGVSFDFD